MWCVVCGYYTCEIERGLCKPPYSELNRNIFKPRFTLCQARNVKESGRLKKGNVDGPTFFTSHESNPQH